MKPDLTGKVIVVTGANSGIGFVACKEFAQRGATLALVCRDRQKGLHAQELLQKLAVNEKPKLFLADLSSLAETQRVAAQLLEQYDAIDVLLNNAGGANEHHQLSPEGFEITFVSNHLSGFLLTLLLLPRIAKAAQTARARIVFSSSLGHKNSPLDFDDLNLLKNYGTLKAYGRSKLMNLLTAMALHDRYGQENIAVSSFHPGAVRTAIWRKGGWLSRLIGIIIYPFMRSENKGAETLIWLAAANDELALSPNGRYFMDKKPAQVADFATAEAAQRLYEVSSQLVEPWSTS